MNVKLVTYTPEVVISDMAKNCYANNTEKDLTRSLVHSHKHLAVLRFAFAVIQVDGISIACFDEKAEVLTKNGWKKFKDTTYIDEFATLNLQTNEVEFQQGTDYIEYEYNGKMHKYDTKAMSICMTENHNVVHRSAYSKEKKYILKQSNDISTKAIKVPKIFNYNNDIGDAVIIDGYEYTRNSKSGTFTKTVKDLKLDRHNFIKLMSWYIADGSVVKRKDDEHYCITISQKDKLHKQDICNIILELGFNPYMDENGISFSSQALGKFFKRLGISNNKYIPFNEFDFFDKQTAKLFLDEYLKSDGHKDKNGINSFYTSSKKLADQLYNIINIAGLGCSGLINDNNVGKEFTINGKTYKSNYPIYTIRYSDKQTKNIEAHIKLKDRIDYHYNGKVYCVTVPNSTLFVRTEGKFNATWVGNCQNQVVRSSHLSYLVQSKRYVSLDRGEFTFIYPPGGKEAMEIYDRLWNTAIESYNELLSIGTKKEDARAILPMNTSTKMGIAGNLQAWMDAIRLRVDTKAQLEIRTMYIKIWGLLKEVYPNVFIEEMLVNGRTYNEWNMN